MKNTIYSAIIALLISVSQFLYAQENVGINFLKNKTWEETIAIAKAENKLIFVDVYTDWCGPCKVMDNEVFNQTKVASVFNNSFINYKLDAEKGEGPALAKKYTVKSYPNYLFINSEGILVYRSTSSMPVNDFINVGKNALLEANQKESIVQLDLLYPQMRKDKVFMKRYLDRRTLLRLENSDLLDEYISMLSEEERGEITNLQLIADNGMFLAKNLQLGISLETLKKHKSKFGDLKLSYKEGIDGIENTAIKTTQKKAIAKKDVNLLNKVLELKKSAHISMFDNKESVELEYYFGTRQNLQFIKLANAYATNHLLKISLDTLAKRDVSLYQFQLNNLRNSKNFKGNLEEEAEQYKHAVTIQLTNALNTLSKNVSVVSNDSGQLKKALEWMNYIEKITDTDPSYYENVIPFYTESQAILNYKIGNKKIAIEKLENMLVKFKNPRINSYFSPIILKMKANEIL
ncbi:MAG: DUF255 domain-containing protein [Pedobacter sp.]|nr:MAG: DUF255 domain-containing protein [Pedobacter sp.]